MTRMSVSAVRFWNTEPLSQRTTVFGPRADELLELGLREPQTLPELAHLVAREQPVVAFVLVDRRGGG